MKTILALGLLLCSNLALAVIKPNCIGDIQPVSGCVITTYPSPSGGVIDFETWMTTDPSLRGQIHMMPGYVSNEVIYNKILYTKFNLIGDNWDAWTYDEDYIYFYKTGNNTTFVKAPTETDSAWISRYVQLGYPGERLVIVGAHWESIVQCVIGDINPSSNSISELWGPYQHNYTGNIGTQQIVILKTWWDCHGIDPSSCSQEEDFSFSQPYGWIDWENYTAPLYDGNFQWANGGPFDTMVDGGSGVLDWCFLPSIFAAPVVPIITIPDKHVPFLPFDNTQVSNKKVIQSVPFFPINHNAAYLEGNFTEYAMAESGIIITVTENGLEHSTTSVTNGFYRINNLTSGKGVVSFRHPLTGVLDTIPITIHEGENDLNIPLLPVGWIVTGVTK